MRRKLDSFWNMWINSTRMPVDRPLFWAVSFAGIAFMTVYLHLLR